MPFDGISTYASVAEIGHLLIGSKIQRIYQPLSDEIVLLFSGLEKGLVVSSNATYPRCYITEKKYENPEYPPSFCMLLRKHLVGGIVKNVCQNRLDRIIDIKVEALNNAGKLSNLCLTIELMGKHSNIILYDIDSNKILDSIKHISGLKSSIRKVMPGFDYKAPPNNKLDLFDYSKSDAIDLYSFHNGNDLSVFFVNTFTGISKQLAKSYLADIGFDGSDNVTTDRLCELLDGLAAYVENRLNSNENCLYIDEKGDFIDFSHGRYNLNKSGLLIKNKPSFGSVCDDYYRQKVNNLWKKEKNQALISELDSILHRELRKLESRKKELTEAENSEILYMSGNLILSNLSILKKGMREFETANYYSETYDNITIPLKENLSPSENAQYYFKKYNKSKNAVEHLKELIKEGEDSIYYLSNQLYFLSEASTEQEFDSVYNDIVKNGYIKKSTKKNLNKSQQGGKLNFGRLTTKSGSEILYGKNSKQNDELTFRIAGKNDIWFHAKNIAGSHVVLRCKNGAYTEEDLLEAAETAAYYSSARRSEKVDVDYTLVKNVKKIPGAPLGKVTFVDNKTIYVTPKNLSEEI